MTQDKDRGVDFSGAPSPEEQTPAVYQDNRENREKGVKQEKAEQQKNNVEGSPNQGTDARSN